MNYFKSKTLKLCKNCKTKSFYSYEGKYIICLNCKHKSQITLTTQFIKNLIAPKKKKKIKLNELEELENNIWSDQKFNY